MDGLDHVLYIGTANGLYQRIRKAATMRVRLGLQARGADSPLVLDERPTLFYADE